MRFDLATSVVWALQTVLKLLVIVLMLRRSLHREYRLFFLYLVYKVSLTSALLVLRRSYTAYFVTYWAGEALEVVLAFAVIYEIFALVLRPYPGIRRIAATLSAWVAVLLVGIAAVLAMLPHANEQQVISLLLTGQRTMAVLQLGLLLFLFLFAASLGLTWRHHLFGIAMGFGLLGVATLGASAIRAAVGPGAVPLFHWVAIGSYLSALFVWAGYFLTTEPSVLASTTLPRETNLQRWNEALMRVLQQ